MKVFCEEMPSGKQMKSENTLVISVIVDLHQSQTLSDS
jgi:hypothetical protein